MLNIASFDQSRLKQYKLCLSAATSTNFDFSKVQSIGWTFYFYSHKNMFGWENIPRSCFLHCHRMFNDEQNHFFVNFAKKYKIRCNFFLSETLLK